MKHIVNSLILALCAISINGFAAEDAIYSTSFENFKSGLFSTLADEKVTWSAVGKAEITTQFFKSGKQALHLFGGTYNTLELQLSGPAQKTKGIRFQAERWTKKSPFKCRIEAFHDGGWKEFANLDKVIQVGARLKTQVALPTPETKITGLRIIVSAPPQAGIIIDDFALLSKVPEKPKAPKPVKVPTKTMKLLENTKVFISGTEDTHTFRIPAIITAMNGDLIAACDARRESRADLIWVKNGSLDIVFKRSTDNGATWSEMGAIGDFPAGYGASDPSFVLDKSNGHIFCFYNFMDQIKAPKIFRYYVQRSTDNGKTWDEAIDYTDSVCKPEWEKDFRFITSGRGIQLRSGELLHTIVNLKNGLYLFGSTDHGKTWKLRDTAIKPANESKVVELTDGTLMINSRANGTGMRWVHRSTDNGKTWTSEAGDYLPDPGCNGAIIQYTSTKDGYAKNRLLFCNAGSVKGRKNLSVRISYDEGKTWSDGRVIEPGPSAYSELTILKDGTIGVLYEPGYSAIRFARFTLEDLTDGQDKLTKPYEL